MLVLFGFRIDLFFDSEIFFFELSNVSPLWDTLTRLEQFFEGIRAVMPHLVHFVQQLDEIREELRLVCSAIEQKLQIMVSDTIDHLLDALYTLALLVRVFEM